MKPLAWRLKRFRWPTKRELIIGGGTALAGLIVMQLLYPSAHLLPGTSIHGLDMGVWTRESAVQQLEGMYSEASVDVYLGDNPSPTTTVPAEDIGIVVDPTSEVAAYTYPWYVRLVPSSILWYGRIDQKTTPSASHDEATRAAFIESLVGKDCEIKPVNATIAPSGEKVSATEAVAGGTCERDDVVSALAKVVPSLESTVSVSIPVTPIEPEVTTDDAKQLAGVVNDRLARGVTIKAGDSEVKLDTAKVASWLGSKTVDGKMVLTVDSKKSSEYLTSQLGNKVAVAAGTTYVTTHDFVETSRKNGASGRALNVVGTGSAIADLLMGKNDTASAATTKIEPTVKYTRTYSKTDTGISALIQHYAQDHPGTYGVQMIELSGNRRRAGYNASKVFTTASTYKLYVAYGTLKKVEAGDWKWSDSISGGRNLTTCFDDMIVKSDNACAEALLSKLGFRSLTTQIHDLGLTNSSFLIGDSPTTTAGDLATFMAMLQARQLGLKTASYDRFVDALKRNIFRQGIPAGASGTVADKVGFLNGLLHDAAIVYSPKGTYTLAIMTDGSTWANIADLTKKIEALR